MLLTRVLTAFVGIPILLAIIIIGPRPLYICFVEAGIFIALYEFFELSEAKSIRPIKWTAILCCLVFSFSFSFGLHALYTPLLLIGLFMIFSIYLLLFDLPHKTAATLNGYFCIGLIYIGLCTSLLLPMRELSKGPFIIILAMAATWVPDTLAYLCGRFLGRNKMIPRLSPGKTWEGFCGGLVGSFLAVYIMKLLFLNELSLIDVGTLGLTAGILGPLGDLFESLLKRSAGEKDSGGLLPGHGGILDRIDALIFNIPLFYFYAIWRLQ